MPWCPKCKDEYRKGFTHCSTCGMELVDTYAEAEDFIDTGGLSEPVYRIKDHRIVKGVIAMLEDRSIPFRIDECIVYVAPSHAKKAEKLLEGENAAEGAKEAEGLFYEGDGSIVMGIAKREKDIPKITEALEEAGISYTVEGKGIFVPSDQLEEALEATEPYNDLLLSEAEADEEYSETDDAIEGIMNNLPGSTWYWGGETQEEEDLSKQPLHEAADPARTGSKAFDVPEAFKAEYKPVQKDEHELGEEPKKKRGLFRKKDEQEW